MANIDGSNELRRPLRMGNFCVRKKLYMFMIIKQYFDPFFSQWFYVSCII